MTKFIVFSMYVLYICMYVCIVCMFVSCCQNFKGPYLEAEVVEEVIGWLGLVGTATANKFVATP